MTRTVATLLCLLLFLVAFLLVVLVSAEEAASLDDPPPSSRAEPLEGLAATLTIERLERELRHWKQRYAERGRVIRAQRRLARRLIRSRPIGNHWLERAFLCVKAGEGGWASATGNGFYGGLQMDRSFQRTYGREFVRQWGWANKWPAAVQITVGIRGWLQRGFQPWPNTARDCGLR